MALGGISGTAERAAVRPSTEERILSALGDPVARAILQALGRGERDVHALVLETGRPQSSVYRKLKELYADGLVYVPRYAFTAEGHKVEVFRGRLREIHVHLTRDRLRVEVVPGEDSADRLGAMWQSVRRIDGG